MIIKKRNIEEISEDSKKNVYCLAITSSPIIKSYYGM